MSREPSTDRLALPKPQMPCLLLSPTLQGRQRKHCGYSPAALCAIPVQLDSDLASMEEA